MRSNVVEIIRVNNTKLTHFLSYVKREFMIIFQEFEDKVAWWFCLKSLIQEILILRIKIKYS